MPDIQIIPAPFSFGSQLGAQLGGGLGQGLSQGLNQYFQRKQIDNKEKDLIQRGYPPYLAKLAAVTTVGGETEAFKHLLDEMRRGNTQGNVLANAFPQQQGQPQQPQAQQPQENAPQAQAGQLPERLPEEQGLTSSERVKRQSERYKANQPIYKENKEKQRALEKENIQLGSLERLNESGKLPESFGRLNVTKEGELRFPFLSNKESQLFVKTVNDFTTGAKDTFGARVTNFELARFMSRLPTLLNTKDGRQEILREMKIINEINRLHTNAINDVYKKYGIRGIDYDRAESLADEMIGDKVAALQEQYMNAEESLNSIENGESKRQELSPGQTFESLPPASQYPNAIFSSGSKKYRSNGKTWKEVK